MYHIVCSYDMFLKIKKILYVPGAVVDAVDKDGNSPLHIAARYGHELLINTLMSNGADPLK